MTELYPLPYGCLTSKEVQLVLIHLLHRLLKESVCCLISSDDCCPSDGLTEVHIYGRPGDRLDPL